MICENDARGYTSAPRDIMIPVVLGPMGSGRTTMVVKVVEKVLNRLPNNKIINCYVRLDSLLKEIPSLATMGATSILISILVHAFTGLEAPVETMWISEVGERIISAFGSKFVILHLDEFHVNPKLSKSIVMACQITMITSGYPICVMPILSGISSLGLNITAPSSLCAAVYSLES